MQGNIGGCSYPEYENIMREIQELEKKMADDNEAFVRKLGPTAWQDFIDLTDSCKVTDYVSLVTAPDPTGHNNSEQYGIFTQVYVRQWTAAGCEDVFYGFLYAKVGDTDQWLKIPYEC